MKKEISPLAIILMAYEALVRLTVHLFDTDCVNI